MKRKKHGIFIFSFILMLLVYQSCAIAATAADEPLSEDAAASIYSGSELTDWLDSHMYTGGTARLEDNITLDESYNFTPWSGCPDIIVETGGYTVTVSGNVEFMSDGHLTFQGIGGEQGIFYVKSGGSLSLDGVNVNRLSEGYALWQEESAGLIVAATCENCSVTISGDIHYADRPFVTDSENICVVIEEGQSLPEALPAQIKCRVIYEGKSLFNEPMAVSWNLEGTGEWQEQRQRFSIQGSFTDAEADTAPVCTVVYNDYPLTFTKAEAFVRGNAYTFRGEYTKPEEPLPITVEEAYSLDGESWTIYRSNLVQDANEGFYILLPCGDCDISQHPYIYIRLRCEKNGKEYISNILRYESDNLNVAEDIGGGRGGGTAIVNTPSEPEETPAALPSDNTQYSYEQSSSGNLNPNHSETLTLPDVSGVSESTTQPDVTASSEASIQPDVTVPSEASIQPDVTVSSEASTQSDATVSSEASIQSDVSESSEALIQPDASESSEASIQPSESASSEPSTLTVEHESYDSRSEVLQAYEEQLESDMGLNKKLIIAACFTLFSGVMGAAAYYLSGTKR